MGFFGLSLSHQPQLVRPQGQRIFDLTPDVREKQVPLAPISNTGSGWWPVVREPYPGAWQRNDEIVAESVLGYAAVFACVTLIAADISKLCLNLVREVEDDIWEKTDSPAFSPVLRKPNDFQTTPKFIESWMISKLTQGNAYVLKQRDRRGVVVALYVLDPLSVTPLVAPNGEVYYELKRDDLSRLTRETLIVPASEVIHDRDACLYHPLIGVSRVTACGLAALQGMAIQTNTKTLFANASMPSGILTSPNEIPDTTALRIKENWETAFRGENVGRIAVAGNGLKFERIPFNAVDMQLIDQLKWTGENICTCYRVPAYMVGIGPPPPYANVGPLLQQYYEQCLQKLIIDFETSLDEGLGLNVKIDGTQYGTELDIDDLIWMDAEARTKTASEAIGGAGLSVNEARKKYFGMGKTKGGESPMLQQQMFSLAALAERDASKPFAKPEPPQAPVAPEPQPQDALAEAASMADLIEKAFIEQGIYATE